MPELKKPDILLKTKDGLLKTEDILLKTKGGPSVNRKLLTHILTNVPTHTQASDLDNYNKISLWLSLTRKPMGLKLSPLKTSSLAAVQV